MSADKAFNSELPAGDRAARRWDLLLMVLLWLPLVCLYIWAMDRLPFHEDEYRTLYDVRESIPVLMADRLRHAHQPLYFLAAWVCAKVFGSDSLIGMRILPQVASFVAVGFLYATARHLAGRYAAVLAVVLCLLSISFMWVCHNARPASFLVLFVMAATYFIVSAGDKPGRGRQVLIGAMALLALLSYNAAIPVIAVMMIGVLFAGQTRWRLFFPLLIAMTVFIPWFIYTTTWYDVGDRLGWLTPGGWMEWPGAVLNFTYNGDLIGQTRTGAWWAIAAVSVIWTAHLGAIVYGFSRNRRFGMLLGLMWIVPLAFGLFSLIVLDVNTMRVERYFAITVMCQAIGLAFALVSISTRVMWLRPAVCAVVLAVAAAGLIKELKKPAPVREMDFVEYLRDHTSDGQVIYVLQFVRLKYQAEYYLDVQAHMLPTVYGLEPIRDIEKFGVEPVDVGHPMSPMPHEGADELLVLVYQDELDLEPAKSRYSVTQEMRDKIGELTETFETVEIIQMDNGQIYHFRR